MRQALQQAIDWHQRGRAAEAEAAYRAILARQPGQFEALHGLGLLRLQQGRFAEAHDLVSAAVKQQPQSARARSTLGSVLMALGRAEAALACFDAILKQNPNDLDARYNRAVVAGGLGRAEQALGDYDRVLAARPRDAAAWFNRGNLLAQMSRDAEALTAYDRALAVESRLADAWLNRGNVLSRVKRYDDAIASFDRALSLDPRRLDALNGRAIALTHLERYDEAQSACERALAVDPGHPAVMVTVGNLAIARGRPRDAIVQFDRVLVKHPGHPDALHNKGYALAALRRLPEAVACYDRALQSAPRHGDALNNRGVALFKLGRWSEALASFEAALAIQPDNADVLANRAQLLSKTGRYGDAVADCTRVLELEPQHPTALGDLASYQLAACDWTATSALPARLDRAVTMDKAVVPPFIHVALPTSAADHLRYTRAYVQRRSRSLAQPACFSHEPRTEGRIRLAYLSADFYRHPTAWLAAEMFEHHDRSRFEIVGVSYGPDDGSDIRRRLIKSFDQFHDVASCDDSEAAKLLFDLSIDIAVDLKGHTEHARPDILAGRPAPVQVAYLGYPGTTALDFIDYVIADPIVLPLDQQPYFTERIVHLPDSYQVNDSRKLIAAERPPRRALGLPEQGFVFCCFNQSYKFTREVFDVWMRLLGRVEGSVLWLLDSNAEATANLRKEAAARGVDPARLVFAPKMDLPAHLARHRAADLFLDTLPCNAHTTASDALWAGLPVLTCLGETFAGRVAASLLHAIGLPELVTQNLADYEALAGRLAGEPALLASIRSRLEQNRPTHPLFDAESTCRHIEAAYTTMWEIWRAGEPPRRFAVAPISSRPSPDAGPPR